MPWISRSTSCAEMSLAEHPGLLRVGEQPVGRLPHRHPAAGDELGVLADRLDQRPRQPALGGEVARHRPHPAEERLLGRHGDDELVGRRADGQHLAAVDRRLQVGPGREVPVEGADPDPGPAGDVVERRVRAVLGERGGGRLEQLDAAAARVRAHLRARLVPAVGRGDLGPRDVVVGHGYVLRSAHCFFTVQCFTNPVC